MNAFESRLAEQVRLYKHLYDPSFRDRSYIHMASNSWKEIAATLGKDEAVCRRVWKSTRDCYVKAKKRTRAKSAKSCGNTAVPRILVELEWLSQFIKHRKMESNFDLEDKMGLNSNIQKTPLKFSTIDVHPPISSSTPGNFFPSPYLSQLSGPPSVEMTPSSSASPLHDSPSSSRLSDYHVARLELLDQERQKLMQQDNADSRFAEVIKDMLANINPKHKPDVKFKVYQVLFEAERDCPKQS